MVRKYFKKTNRVNIDEHDVAAAINDIINGNCSLRNAGATYGIHFATLQYRLKLYKQKHQIEDQDEGGLSSEDNNEGVPHQHFPPATPEVRTLSKYSTRQIFSSEQEAMLEEYLIKSSKMQYGLTSKQLREFAFKYAMELKLTIPHSWEGKSSAGVDWLHGFLKRHPRLSLRKPENTSLARASSFNKNNVDMFFDKYESVMLKYKFPPVM